MTSIYQEYKDKAETQFEQTRKQSRTISWMRVLSLLTVAVLLYFYFFYFQNIYLLISLVLVIVYLGLVNKHQKLKEKMSFYEREIDINSQEIIFLQNNYYPFSDGIQFSEKDSLFQHDLDILGDHSIFQYLNRCHSYMAQEKLAHLLLDDTRTEEVKTRQDAIDELSPDSDFRNQFLVRMSLADINKEKSARLENWAKTKPASLPAWKKILAVIVSAAIFILGALSIANVIELPVTKILQYGAPIMLLLLMSISKNIRNEIAKGDKLSESLLRLSQIQKLVEEKNFQNPELKKITAGTDGQKYSENWNALAKILRNLESINNPLGALILNALIPFHIYYYDKLVQWHDTYAAAFWDQVHRLSEMELWLSLSQYNFNNPENVAFDMDASRAIQLNQARHPLMKPEESVANSIDFGASPLYILTGSNMSGKSTFLRTIGSLLVMAKLGLRLPCASANIHLHTLAPSMRISDSLSDSSSFFHAELTKLQKILNDTQSRTLVLLDEILRGTNSDDKRTGTVEVIKKLMNKKDLGIVATHDLEVCQLAEAYPDQIKNICFESEIEGDDLHFDYKLRDGVCKNKNATFLMKKMHII